jgi:hypothetical protein
MPATDYAIASFAYGELSEKYVGRSDSAFYKQGCRKLRNAFALSQGPAEKRSGTLYAASAKTLSRKVLLIPWVISPTEGRVLEFGHNYIRFYSGVTGLRIENPPGTPVETSTTYTESDLPLIRVRQVSSYMYIVCKGHKEAMLTRVSDNSWTLADVTNTAGAGEENFATNYPALIEFYEDRKILAKTPVALSTFWGSRTAQYNNFSLETSAVVTCPVASPGVVYWTAHGLTANQSVVFTTTGALPTGLLVGVEYYIIGSSITADTFQVSAVAGSGTPINFTGSTSGTHTGYATPALATDAWQKTPLVQKNAEILWLLAGDAFLFGTSLGPYRVAGEESTLTGDAVWWPQLQAAVGCGDVPAIMVDDFACFVGKSGKKIYRFQFEAGTQKYLPNEITFLAGHITGHGVIGMVHQRDPTTILWAWTQDGVLISGSYGRIPEQTETMVQSGIYGTTVHPSTIVIGWSQHDLTGLVESACVIPTTVEDQVWVSVARTIGGVLVRHIEHFAPRDWDYMEDYHGVDAGIVWDGGAQVTVSGITKANPAVCTAIAHGFANNDLVRFSGVAGITDANGQVYTVKNKATDTFELWTRDGSTTIDFSGQPVPGSGGLVEKVYNHITGLDHLEGCTVKTLGDASVISDAVVTGGAITLAEYANKVRVGLPFTSIIQPMPVAVGGNHLKRVKKVFAHFYKTGDAQAGDGVHADEQIVFDGVPTMDVDPVEETEGMRFLFDGFSDFEGNVRITSTQPLPQTVAELVYELQVGS